MSETITDLTRGTYAYDSDDGNTYLISMRNVYATASGLSLSSSGTPLPKNSKPRHVWISADNGSGHILRRKFPASKAKMATYEGTGGTATVSGIDGLTWNVHGFTGEKRKK